jgi:hypothetical protein
MKFSIGDLSALSNWDYKENMPLVILMVIFSLLITLYLMNLLIGLLNMHIGNIEDNRASYLKEKAKVLLLNAKIHNHLFYIN